MKQPLRFRSLVGRREAMPQLNQVFAELASVGTLFYREVSDLGSTYVSHLAAPEPKPPSQMHLPHSRLSW